MATTNIADVIFALYEKLAALEVKVVMIDATWFGVKAPVTGRPFKYKCVSSLKTR